MEIEEDTSKIPACGFINTTIVFFLPPLLPPSPVTKTNKECYSQIRRVDFAHNGLQRHTARRGSPGVVVRGVFADVRVQTHASLAGYREAPDPGRVILGDVGVVRQPLPVAVIFLTCVESDCDVRSSRVLQVLLENLEENAPFFESLERHHADTATLAECIHVADFLALLAEFKSVLFKPFWDSRRCLTLVSSVAIHACAEARFSHTFSSIFAFDASARIWRLSWQHWR